MSITNINNADTFVGNTYRRKPDEIADLPAGGSAAAVLAQLTVSQSNAMVLATEDMQFKMDLLHKVNDLMVQLKALFANMKSMDNSTLQYIQTGGDGSKNNNTSQVSGLDADLQKKYFDTSFASANSSADGLTFTYTLGDAVNHGKNNKEAKRTVNFTIPPELLSLFNIPVGASAQDQADIIYQSIRPGGSDTHAISVSTGVIKTYTEVNESGYPYGPDGFLQRLTTFIIDRLNQMLKPLNIDMDSGAFNLAASSTITNAVASANSYCDTVIQPQLNQYSSKLQQLAQTTNQYLGMQQTYQNTTRG